MKHRASHFFLAGFALLVGLSFAFVAIPPALAVDADIDCVDDVTGGAISGCSPRITADELLPTEFGEATGLGTTDVRIVIGNVIRVILGFLGIIAVVLIIYAGFLWMTAAGNDEKVERAKKVLINATIGLILVLSSYAIASYVISQLADATGFVGGDVETDDDVILGGGPADTTSLFVIEGASPQGTQTIKNLTVRVTFNKDVDSATVAANFVVRNTDAGTDVPGTLSIVGDRISFTPTNDCVEAPGEKCFEDDTNYEISVGAGLLSEGGLAISCGGFYDSCTYTFMSGNIVDVSDPTITLSYPDDGDSIEEDTFVTMRAETADDAGVSLVEFYVDDVLVVTDQPVGPTPTEFSAEGVWDTSLLPAGATPELYAIVYDVNGHDVTSSTVDVTIRAAHCFNGETDTDETGEDCGGADCGLCPGDACSTDSECASGVCTGGVCVDAPEITDITPLDGAPGTYVTVKGTNFGGFTGSVFFGTEEAELASCDDPWNTDQIIVVVPEALTAGSYPISVTTSDGISDTNSDDNGALFSDFTVNTTERPGICELTPEAGTVGSIVTVEGQNFGATQGDTGVYFGSVVAGSYSDWSDEEIRVSVPTLIADPYAVAIWASGITSNEVEFTVNDPDVGDLPLIASVDPESGPIGQYVTLTGEAFGSSIGTVEFTNTNPSSANFGVSTTADVLFPAECANDYWSGNQVTVKVPSGLETTSYDITLTRQDDATSEPIVFSVTAGVAGPGICALDPDAGPIGFEDVSIFGEGFGPIKGTVEFYDGSPDDGGVSATVLTWEDGEVHVSVPSGSLSGPLVLTNTSLVDSNETNFAIGNCNEIALCDSATQQCCSSGVCMETGESCPGDATFLAAYTWRFSTGVIPVVPQLLVECSDLMISPTPWGGRTGGRDVCVNAAISGTFDTDMKKTTMNATNIQVAECGETCDPADIVATVPLGTINKTDTSFTAYPSSVLKVATTYLVTLTSGITSIDGTAIETTAWEFTTRDSADLCDIEAVNVTPHDETIEALDGTASFNAQAVSDDACVILDATSYEWMWSTDGTFADLADSVDPDCTGAPSTCQVAIGLQEGESFMIAEEASQGADDSADLHVDFSDPYVKDFAPDCGEACINAAITATFNVAMESTTVEAAGAVTVYECTNEACTTFVNPAGIRRTVDLSDADPTMLTIIPKTNLNPNTYYRVVLSGTMESTSGVALTELNYPSSAPTAFSWTFKTRDSEDLCAIDRVELSPPSVTLDYVGATSAFEASAFGEPDSCSTGGQELTATVYSWAWAVVNTSIAELWENGEVVAAAESVPEGCSASCLPEGTQSYSGICGIDADGDGSRVDPGEDCDDGNAEDGDGCSVSCQTEGTDLCASFVCDNGAGACTTDGDCSTETCDESIGFCTVNTTTACTQDSDCPYDAGTCGGTGSGCCGNGTLDAGEECDGGDSGNNDGCSDRCLNEGSGTLWTCGDGVVTHFTTGSTAGGEECDTADGCSPACTNEGTPANLDLVGVCGNGVAEDPAEECDDGNDTSGDGCSSICLFEGSAACVGEDVTSCCGNGIVESGVFESCDDSGSENGDGCSSSCLLEGSSLDYGEPSWCGDTVVGEGESAACEAGVSDLDGLVEPTQVAIIVETAPAEVVDGIASTEVTAGTEGEEAASQLSLTCSCTSDGDCSDPDALGCGVGGCCFSRPEIVEYAPVADPACRNTAISVTFSESMDAGSFEDNIIVTLELSEGGECPYETETASAPRPFLARAWFRVKQFFARIVRPLHAQEADCRLPVTFSSSPTTGGERVSLIYTELLEAGGKYRLDILGDPDQLGEGVRSANNVGLADDWTVTVNIGSDVCQFQEVLVVDEDEESPGLFTQENEVHDYHASAIARVDGAAQELAPIPDVYAWSWKDTWWSTDDAVLSIDHSADAEGDDAVVTAEGENGEIEVFASATITVDDFFGEVDSAVSGSVDATANLCENSWPPIIEGKTWTPFMDDEDGNPDPDDDGVDEIEELTGFMHFSTYYCRDSGAEGVTDDLPALDAAAVATPPSGVLKEYLLQTGTGDAIGVRVVSNTDLLPIDAWYDAQGFTGAPSATQVDGYEALEDGRTVYINAANQTDGGPFYANVYALSYNQDASSETTDIFNQLLTNMSFNTNMTDEHLCYRPGTRSPVFDADGNTTTCNSDFECGSGENCRAAKTKVTRDLKRLTDLRLIETALEAYGELHGRCSATTGTSCATSADCPLGESCQALYPEIGSGSFLRSMTTSAWESWDGVLAAELDASLPTDPLNRYMECGDPDGAYANYATDTCWYADASLYVCPDSSNVYTYRNIGGTGYELTVDVEHESYQLHPWGVPIDRDTTDGLTLLVGNASADLTDGFQTTNVCDGTTYGASELCGDGVLGSGELCESGQTSDEACSAIVCVSADADYDGRACFVDCNDPLVCAAGDADGNGTCDGGVASGLSCGTGSVDCTDSAICDGGYTSASGTRTTTCNSSCDAYERALGAECVPVRCGNGILEIGEDCDDGSHNGDYGYCGALCTWSGAFYCGDGTLAGGEACDLGSDNGVYATNPADSCSADCSGTGPSCGDLEVNGGEECDGSTDEWAGSLCCGGTNAGDTCSVADDCPGGSCGNDGSCTSAHDACTDEVVDGISYPRTRVRTCEDDITAADACEWEKTWKNTACTRSGECGNGTVEGAEVCDDGNTSNNDSCTTGCQANVCGDGFLLSGTETCDAGVENGELCEAEYGTTCRYCSESCVYLTSSGDFCGDGALDPTEEFCDGSLLSIYRCYDSATDAIGATCATVGSTSECAPGYTCRNVGVCNGGGSGGEYCTYTTGETASGSDIASCGTGYDCVRPSCDVSCTNSCPFTYTDGTVTITSEEAGSSPQSSLEIYSYQAGEGTPDEATLTIPACEVVSSLTADISQANRIFPDVDVIFILDKSQSMDGELDDLSGAVADSIDELFDAYQGVSATMRIGLAYIGGLHGTDFDASGAYSESELEDFVLVGLTEDESDLLASLNADFASIHAVAGTPVYGAIASAEEELAGSTADERYIVLFTDGNVWNDEAEMDMLPYALSDTNGINGQLDEYVGIVTDLTDGVKDDGIEIFTAVLTSTSCDISQMEHWSSMSCSANGGSCSERRAEGNYDCEVPENGITYSYSANDAEDLAGMYEEIVNAILDVTVTAEGTGGIELTDTVTAGDNITIPFPSDFVCDPNEEQDLSLKVSFNGSGTIEFSNFVLNMCAP